MENLIIAKISGELRLDANSIASAYNEYRKECVENREEPQGLEWWLKVTLLGAYDVGCMWNTKITNFDAVVREVKKYLKS